MKKSEIKRLLHLIEFLNGFKEKTRRKYLQAAPTAVIKFLTDLCYNVLLGNIKLDLKVLSKLKLQRRLIESLCKKKISLKKRKKILMKKKFFSDVIAPIIPTLRAHYGVFTGNVSDFTKSMAENA